MKYYTLFLYYTFVVLRWKKNIYNNKADFTFIDAGSIIFFLLKCIFFFISMSDCASYIICNLERRKINVWFKINKNKKTPKKPKQ